MQLYAEIYLLLNYSTGFGRQSHLSSGVQKTAVAASGKYHAIWEASFFKLDQIRTGLRQSLWILYSDCRKPVLIWSRLKKLASQIVWSVPEAPTAVLYAVLHSHVFLTRRTNGRRLRNLKTVMLFRNSPSIG